MISAPVVITGRSSRRYTTSVARVEACPTSRAIFSMLTCPCRKCRSHWSSGVLVFVDDASDPVASSDPEGFEVGYLGAVEKLAAASADSALGDRVAPHRQLHPIRMIGTDASG
jgi:hypothetical protein